MLEIFCSRRGSQVTKLEQTDKAIYDLVQEEVRREQDGLELIPSENFVSEAVLEAQGSVLTNKYAEGLPGKRYYGGCEYVDGVEQLAIDRVKSFLMRRTLTCSLIVVPPLTRLFILQL